MIRAPRASIFQSSCALFFLTACSSSSAAPADAGRPEAAAPVDAGHESGTGFPVDDSGPPDAGSECDQMRAQVTTLQTAARACNPQGVSECSAAVDGICCPITVSISNNGPVNDFTQAVLAYKQKCNPDCSKVICGTTPTNVCEGTGNQGLCATPL